MIKRTDNRQTNNANEKVNQLLKNSKLHVINNDNIKEKQLGKRELHLNTHSNVLLTNNVLHAAENPKRNADHNDSDFIDDDLFLVNTDSESDLLTERVTGDKKMTNLESDVSGLINLRKKFPNNPMIAYPNINSLGSKINHLPKIFL